MISAASDFSAALFLIDQNERQRSGKEGTMNLSLLNDMQKKAVTTVDGPLLVLAGAGSGKTSVLTNRVAYLIEEIGASPYEILAITFTNKAANEMKERISSLLNMDVRDMWISTFHSMCVRILRREAGKLGYENGFSIYDSQDSLSVVKKILSDMEIDTNFINPKLARSAISDMKNSGLALGQLGRYLENKYPVLGSTLLEVYKAYGTRLKRENAMDFDDLLLNTVLLFEQFEPVRDYYARKFRYVLVDEYQDTNQVQYELVKMLSCVYRNLFVVGDDDQSIYGWRGANIQNILGFEKDFPDAKVIKLEQNYRSQMNILNAANEVIKNNGQRKPKSLWSTIKSKEKPKLLITNTEYEEAECIAREINEQVRRGDGRYGDFAVLYRMHTQARLLEEKLRIYGVPYRVYGGMSFYERKEIKDMIAYLTLLANPNADTAFLRIANTPKRGIGETSLNRIRKMALEYEMSLLEIAMNAKDLLQGAIASKLAAFADMIEELTQQKDEVPVSELIETVFQQTGYHMALVAEHTEEAQMRIENVQELVQAAIEFENRAKDAGEQITLEGFLEDLALISDVDSMDEQDSVTLMTLHSAKGLEFPQVFLTGLEETIFPSRRSVEEGNVEEERRLMYVGMTRAKKTLVMCRAVTRSYFSSRNQNMPSRFLEEIPENMLEVIDKTQRNDRKPAAAEKPASKTVFRGFGAAMPKFESKATEKASAFEPGCVVNHPKFGNGTILEIMGNGEEAVALIDFAAGKKKMFLAFAPLKLANK